MGLWKMKASQSLDARFLSASCSVAPLLVGALPISDTSLFNVETQLKELRFNVPRL